MKCQNCGQEIEKGQVICPFCEYDHSTFDLEAEEKTIKLYGKIALISTFIFSSILAFILGFIAKRKTDKLLVQNHKLKKDTVSYANLSFIVSLVGLFIRFFLYALVGSLIVYIPKFITESRIGELIDILKDLLN